MITLTVSPPIVAIAHPTSTFRVAITLHARGLPVGTRIAVHPSITSGTQLRPIRLPAWLHLPSTVRLSPAGSAIIALTGRAPVHAGAFAGALQFAPMLPHTSGVGVIGTPAVSIMLGQASPPRTVLSVVLPPVRWTRGSVPIRITERNVGRSWVPASVAVDGLSLAHPLPLLPGQSTVWHTVIPVDGWGRDAITATAPGARTTASTWVIPILPIATDAVVVGLVAGAYAAGRRRSRSHPKTKKEVSQQC